jgi:hypothetical protein
VAAVGVPSWPHRARIRWRARAGAEWHRGPPLHKALDVMVTFALTRRGYDSVRRRGSVPSPLWVAPDVLSDTEIQDLRANGIVVTNFTQPINIADPAAIKQAMGTIAEHHPGERIVVAGHDV